LEPELVLSVFHQQSNRKTSYLRSGNLALRTITYGAGPLMRGFGDEQEKLPPSLEGELRKLGMPVQLKNGSLELLEAFTVCREGAPLSVEGAQILVGFFSRSYASCLMVC
jgi:hypothetical protein